MARTVKLGRTMRESANEDAMAKTTASVVTRKTAANVNATHETRKLFGIGREVFVSLPVNRGFVDRKATVVGVDGYMFRGTLVGTVRLHLALHRGDKARLAKHLLPKAEKDGANVVLKARAA